MSDAAPSHAEHDENHEGPIRTPKQLVGAILAAFIIPVATIVLLASYVDDHTRPAAGSDGLSPEATAARIAPVSTVAVKDPTDLAAMKTGEEVFKGQCSTCHAAGLAGSPKFGDAAAWAPRIKTGYESLLNSALHGKGAMGAQGGGDYSDYEIGRAVVYMANAGGAKFAEPAPPAASAASAPEAPAAAMPAPTAAEPAPAAAPASAPASAAPAPVAATSATTAPAAQQVAAAAAPALYTQVCQTCHAVGLIGAPKVGDKAAWAPRIAQGVDTLTQHAISGKGAMPPKGGAATASDADIKAVVTYMVDASK